jgi:hypothetical protein
LNLAVKNQSSQSKQTPPQSNTPKRKIKLTYIQCSTHSSTSSLAWIKGGLKWCARHRARERAHKVDTSDFQLVLNVKYFPANACRRSILGWRSTHLTHASPRTPEKRSRRLSRASRYSTQHPKLTLSDHIVCAMSCDCRVPPWLIAFRINSTPWIL